MAARVKIGDVVEIVTNRGLAYAQCTHRHQRYGWLIRVLRGTHGTRPKSFGRLVQGDAQFLSFFPLQAAVSRNIVAVVANEPVPKDASEFPVFRAGSVNSATGKVETWWLWDGSREWRVGRLTAEQVRLPIRGIINDTLLVERIESNWRPENDSTT